VPLALDQAPWKIKVYPGAALGKATRKQRARVDAHRKPLSKLIHEVYGAMFLSPGELADVMDRRFTKHAAAALRRSGAGLPKNALGVETTLRRASVSVDASSTRRAAAAVSVKLKTIVDGEPVRIGHKATLWLEREGRRWSVLAFDVRQSKLVPHARKDGGKDRQSRKDGGKDRHARKGGGKDRHARKGGGKDRKASK
jgi:hypothetical protein